MSATDVADQGTLVETVVCQGLEVMVEVVHLVIDGHVIAADHALVAEATVDGLVSVCVLATLDVA